MIRLLDRIAGLLATYVVGGVAHAAAALLFLGAVGITVVIIGRALFEWRLTFLEEYIAYFFMALATLSMGYAALEGTNVRVRFILERLPPRAQFILACAGGAIYVGFGAAVVQRMSTWLIRAFESGSRSVVSATPLWIPYLVAFIGFCIFTLACALVLYHVIRHNGRYPGESVGLPEAQQDLPPSGSHDGA